MTEPTTPADELDLLIRKFLPSSEGWGRGDKYLAWLKAGIVPTDAEEALDKILATASAERLAEIVGFFWRANTAASCAAANYLNERTIKESP